MLQYPGSTCVDRMRQIRLTYCRASCGLGPLALYCWPHYRQASNTPVSPFLQCSSCCWGVSCHHNASVPRRRPTPWHHLTPWHCYIALCYSPRRQAVCADQHVCRGKQPQQQRWVLQPCSVGVCEHHGAPLVALLQLQCCLNFDVALQKTESEEY
jgi:hypothetical protein